MQVNFLSIPTENWKMLRIPSNLNLTAKSRDPYGRNSTMAGKPRLEIISREPGHGKRKSRKVWISWLRRAEPELVPGCSVLLECLISVSRDSPTSTPSASFVLPSIGPQRAKATNPIEEHPTQRSHFGRQSHRLDWLIKRDSSSLPRF